MGDRANQTLLAIDTSGPRLQLALLGDGFCQSHCEDLAKGHAEILFDRIAKLLSANGLKYPNLTMIAVTTGPGSFTGLRIGIAAARGLGLAQKIPVIGIPNLFALSLSAAKGPIDVRLDARRNEYYVQNFSAPGEPDTTASLVSADAFPATFPRRGATAITDPQVDIIVLAQFALTADPDKFHPVPTYIRAADAKPQTKKLLVRADRKS